MRQSSNLGTFTLLAGFVVIWGTGYWPTEVADAHTETIMLSALRVTGGALMLIAVALFSGARFPRGQMLAWAAGSGIVMILLPHWGTTEAVVRAGPGNAAVVVNAIPITVAVLAWLFLSERLSFIGWAGVALGFGGVILMVSTQLGGDTDTKQLLIGVGFGLVGLLGWSAGTLLLRSFALKRGEEMDVLGFATTQFSSAAIVLLIVGFAVNGTSTTEWASGTLWAVITWIGPVSGIAMVLFFLALRRLPAARVSAPMFLIPGVAIVVEVVRGNTPTAIALLGMIVAVIGVGLVNVPRESLVTAGPRLWRQLRGAVANLIP
jgi:drug/metabolite transporter (DMT)-like permease